EVVRRRRHYLDRVARLQIFACTHTRYWLAAKYRLADPNSVDWRSNINCLGSCRFPKIGGRKRVNLILMRGTWRGMARQNVALCSGFGHCEPIEVTRSSRKLPNCDNSEAHYLALWRIGIIKKSPTKGASAAAAEDLNVEIADFLAQRVAIDPEQICRADLVAASGRKRHRQERMLDLPEHPVIEAGRRQSVAEAREIRRQMPLDGG